MTKKTYDNLDIYAASFSGLFGFTCVILAENLVDAHEILERRMKEHFENSRPDFRIIGPMELNKGMLFTVDMNGEVYLASQFLNSDGTDDCDIKIEKNTSNDDMEII